MHMREMMQVDENVRPAWSGLMCRCPQCGSGRLYAGRFSLDVREACERCGLGFRFVDSGDGPAIFAIFILGFLVLGAALIVEFALSPPMWVHIALWTPVTLAATLGLLKPLKGLMIALQFKYKAAEGRFAGDD